MTALLSDKSYDIPLRPLWQRTVLVLVVLVPGVMVTREVVRLTLAAMLDTSFRPADLRRAIAREPQDPAPYNRLGILHLYSLDYPDIPEAISDFHHAIELNPHIAQSWLYLSAACESSGDQACAGNAMAKALSLGPMTPRVRWTAGNYYLRAGQSNLMWTEFRSLVEMDPSYADATFSLCSRAFQDPQLILDKLLPVGTDPKLLLAYADFLLARGNPGQAFRAWTQAASGPRPVSFQTTRAYLDQLISSGQYQDAVAVWDDLIRRARIVTPPPADPGNLVFNGGFEHSPLKAGFDWRSRDIAYVSTDFSDPAPYQGSRCLRIDFTVGHNEEYEPVYELVPVSPDQSYALTAFVRSDSITSDSGPRLRVEDPACLACVNASTATTVGTTPWHAVSLNFITGPHTQVVQLSVWRPRSRSFPMEITGTFWLDDVSIKPASTTISGAQ